MSVSTSRLPQRQRRHNPKTHTSLHAVESDLADLIATNAVALRVALASRLTIRRRALKSLAEDMDAWVVALHRERTEIALRDMRVESALVAWRAAA